MRLPWCSQLIREQMVKSLEIIKDLEEQVKMVPKLKVIFYNNIQIETIIYYYTLNHKIS